MTDKTTDPIHDSLIPPLTNCNPNWELINKCQLWPILGVTECDCCPTEVKCWGKHSQLPEPNPQTMKKLQEIINGR